MKKIPLNKKKRFSAILICHFFLRAANEDPIIDEDDIPDEEIVDLPPQKAKAGNSIFVT